MDIHNVGCSNRSRLIWNVGSNWTNNLLAQGHAVPALSDWGSILLEEADLNRDDGAVAWSLPFNHPLHPSGSLGRTVVFIIIPLPV